jgi:purine-cytosine permease-like protein
MAYALHCTATALLFCLVTALGAALAVVTGNKKASAVAGFVGWRVRAGRQRMKWYFSFS